MRSIFKYAFFLLISFVVVQTPWNVFISEKPKGWDHLIYCRAVDAFEQGKDPYLTENLGVSFSYAYPSLFLKVYSPLCTENTALYVWSQFLLLGLLTFLMVRYLKTDPILSIAWIFLGFNAAYSNYSTGNIGVFEAFLFGLFLILFAAKKNWSSLALVPSAFLKVVPSVMILPVLLNESSAKRRTLQGLFFLAGLTVLNTLTLGFGVDLYRSYLNQILGRYSQHSPIAELDSNPSNITILLFLKNLAVNASAEFSWVILGCFVILLTAFSYWLWKKTIQPESDRFIRLCWSYLILFLWLPRLKPYSMIMVCLLLIPILQKKSWSVAWGVLLLSIFHRSLNGDKANFWWDFIANNSAIYAYIGILAIAAKAKNMRSTPTYLAS